MALGTDRQGSGARPRSKGRPGNGRQDSAFADAVGRDVGAVNVCHIEKPTQEDAESRDVVVAVPVCHVGEPAQRVLRHREWSEPAGKGRPEDGR